MSVTAYESVMPFSVTADDLVLLPKAHQKTSHIREAVHVNLVRGGSPEFKSADMSSPLLIAPRALAAPSARGRRALRRFISESGLGTCYE
ncbi:hypothetical protein EVAR_18332_1 [Eumeta japonica]|uniref:Uncharacterized protein n=1 Tax=Eumeta variegata TaxID=151549 RepID=A0A4C1VAA0_EUMVA|nr:hypothetical protein EVAR_18332_1 [Eumeta japonica]